MLHLPDLTSIKKFFSLRTALFIFLILTIIIVTIVFIRAKTQPPTHPKGTNPIFGQLPAPKPFNQPQNKNPQATTFTPPEKLNLSNTAVVYRLNPSNLTENQARSIAASFAFTTEPQIQKNTILYIENNKVLIIGLSKGSLSYTEPLPNYLQTFTQGSLEEYSRLLVKQAFPSNPFWENPIVQTSYFSIQNIESFTPALPEKAQLATVDVFPTINNLRVFGPYDSLGQSGMVSLKFNRNDNSISFLGFPTSLNTSEVGTYPLKTLETVQQELQTKGALLSATVPAGQTFKSMSPGQNLDPTRAHFTNIELVYYYDPNPNAFLQPMYLFSGKTTLTDGRPADIYAILPAIDPQYLKP